MPIDGTAYLKASDGTLVPLSRVGPQGPKGDPGDPGAQGPAGPAGPLDILTDVTAPASTPAGKVLGTTATGQWGPVDPPSDPVDRVPYWMLDPVLDWDPAKTYVTGSIVKTEEGYWYTDSTIPFSGGEKPTLENWGDAYWYPFDFRGAGWEANQAYNALYCLLQDGLPDPWQAKDYHLGSVQLVMYDGVVYLKSSTDHCSPTDVPGSPGSKWQPMYVPLVGADTPAGKVLGTTAVGQWGAIDPPAGGLSQAQADARYLQLTGGTVQTRHTTIYGHSLLLDINEDEGLMLGTMGPDPDAEFSGVIWTPPMVPGRNGSRVNLSSEFPIMLQTPAATMDSELVDKGYVDARTAGHAYGSVTASIPSGAATQLGIQSAPGAVAVSGGGMGPLILAKTGFWALTVSVEGFTGMNSGTRAFAEIRIQEGTDTRYLRQNVGANEDRITVSGVVRVATGAKITFGAYTSTTAFTANGLYTVKYLGAS